MVTEHGIFYHFIIYVIISLKNFRITKMATKSTTPSNDQLEIDQLAEAEVERLKKQVIDRRQN